MITFNLAKTDGATKARTGVLRTRRGDVPTPAFMPVASQGSVKTLTPQEVRQVGAHMVLANTYHLYLRPGIPVVHAFGGLHSFMGWEGPILTDSGGFQAFSLGALRSISDEGVLFRSHIDGSEHLFTPELSIRYQEGLGADIIMPLDHCIEYTDDRGAVVEAMERTHRWMRRCAETHAESRQALFGIVQGGVFPDLRRESSETLVALDLSGYAVGGLAVGEPRALMYELVEFTADLLPKEKPRYLMGVGSPEELVECVTRGIDMFDCALPTRLARNGALFMPTGRVNIDSARFRDVRGPFMEGCDCYACVTFSAAYLHHLYKAGELLALRLFSIHNLRFIQRLMAEMRQAILDGTFEQHRKAFTATYVPTNELVRLAQKRKWLEARSRTQRKRPVGSED